MKIAFVTPAYYPATIGAALYSTELAENLQKKGHTVKVFTPWKEGMKKHETIMGVEVKRMPRRQITESYYVSSALVKEILKEKFDIIHSHHYGYFPATAGFLAAKLSNTPHVFGPYYHPPVYGVKRSLLFAAYYLTQGFPILKFSDRILPHTNQEKEQLAKIGAPQDKMFLLPNIVNTEQFKPGKKKEKVVLFVSNLLYEKGAHIALDIAEKLLKERKDTKFVFIGNPYQHQLLGRIEKLKATGRVKFLKNLTKEQLIGWYQRSLVLFLPSRYEAFSRVIAEAQASGTAIVATRVGGIPEVVKDGETGFLVDYGDWDRMKEGIDYLLDYPEEAVKMGRKGAAHIRKNFDTKIIVRKLESVYRGVVR